eukprot:gene5681-7843_t
MPVALGENSTDFQTYLLFAVVFTIGITISILKFCFGSISVAKIWENQTYKSKVKDRYNELFSTRDNLLYHISWAKSRGDHEDARKMTSDLTKLDEQIDELELTNPTVFGVRKAKPKGEKLL